MTDFFNKGWAVWLIFGLCAVPELVLVGADLELFGSTRWRSLAYENGGFWVGLLRGWTANYPGQSMVMFLSYGFLHGGITHFLVNMLTLFSVSGIAVDRIGPQRYLVLYVLSLLGGAVGFAVLSSKIQPMVGASGALFGLVGAIVAWEFSERRALGLKQGPVWRLVGFLLAMNLILWWAMDGQLAWETHLGGFVTGWFGAKFFTSR